MTEGTFTGAWDHEEEEQVAALLNSVFTTYPGVVIECFYRTASVPYKARVLYRGREFKPVAYRPDVLVENINNCLPRVSKNEE